MRGCAHSGVHLQVPHVRVDPLGLGRPEAHHLARRESVLARQPDAGRQLGHGGAAGSPGGDGGPPLPGYERLHPHRDVGPRVTIAMKETRIERHLAEDGTPLGPLCSELLRRKHATRRRPPHAAGRVGHTRGSHPAGRGRGKRNARPLASAKRGGGGGGGGGARANGAGRLDAPGAAAAQAVAGAATGGGL
jgi:hypothetical protein